jgi:hypothetical protein
MRTRLILTACLAITACAGPTGAPQSNALVVILNDGEFVETARDAQSSTVEVRKSPPGSVPTSLFALKGSCAVMRARGAKYFSSQRLPGTVATYRLTFPSTAKPEELSGPTRTVFSISDCATLRY